MTMMTTLTERDEHVHEPTDHPLWREGFYFNFYDAQTGLGGATDIALRPNADRKDIWLVLYQNRHEILVLQRAVPMTDSAEPLAAEGLHYELLDPFRRWRIHFEGHLTRLDNRSAPSAFTPQVPAGPREPVTLDLVYETINLPYEYPQAAHFAGAVRHYEQDGRVSGQLRIGTRDVAFTGYGSRDHSWGIRDWQQPEHWFLALAQFQGEASIHAFQGQAEGVAPQAGFAYWDGVNRPLENVQVTAQYEQDSLVPYEAQLEIQPRGGPRLVLRSSILSHAFVTFPRANQTTSLAETLVRFDWLAAPPGIESLVGYGILSYGRQLSDQR